MKFQRFAAVAAALILAGAGAQAQSTFGTILGTVKEPSGAVVPNAKVQILNKGTSAVKSTITNDAGNYQFVNVEVGTYQLSIEAVGFQKLEFKEFDLSARESKRLDADLTLSTQQTTVNVEASGGAVVQTDTSNIAETKGSKQLIELPVAITTRSTGSTSAFSTLTAQPGVQTDASGNIAVAGAMPSQLSFSIDGISSVGPGALGALGELFPSFNAIEEIRISETLNPAEYGGVADITTVSKSGSNNFHGGAFENFQNSDLNAADFFSNTTPTLKMNDFGAYLGGPVIIPKLYNGKNRTFFFGSFEALRLPKQSTAVLSVPTAAMRAGDLSAYSDPILGYPGNIIPATQINAYSTKVLNALYPLPNYGAPGDIANNYLASFNVPINSAQGDARIDEMITSKHLVFVRYTYKNRRILAPPTDVNGNISTPLMGSISEPQVYNALTAAWNWVISPSLVNELRGGFSREHQDVSFGITAQQAATYLGLDNLPGPIPPGDNVPTYNIAGFLGVHSPTADTNPKQGTFQMLETLTWTRSKHTFKFGGDYRHLTSLFTQVFNDYRMGSYTFNGSALGDFLGSGAGTPMASFLLGYPDQTTIATVINPNTNSYANHYAFFGQDDWKVSKDLTLNIGLRYEYHPTFHDHYNNLANFDPNYVSTVDGQTVQGAVIIPGQSTFKLVNPGFVEAVYPTPVITAAQAGIPSALRFSSKTDFAPRIGFAWRVFGDNKTVLRGGWGRFIETLLSSGAIDGWAVESANVGSFTNAIGANGLPIFQAPYSFPSNISQPGTQYFDLASKIHYPDPTVQQWNVTLERDLGKNIGLRLSYDGNHSSDLGTVSNLNQQRPNTGGYDPTLVPFPLLSALITQYPQGYGNYEAGTVSINKRLGSLQFQSSYVFTRNLTNANGVSGNSAGSYVSEFGGTMSDPYSPQIDYGNNPYTRRHRFLTTFLYELPFGKGQKWANGNAIVDRLIGGWMLSGILLFQSGPFMTVTTLNDPSGTGYNLFNSTGGRADTVQGVSPYAGKSINQWINPNAFVDPDNNIGRFGDSSSGNVVGPGTEVVSVSLVKKIAITEQINVEIGAQAANLFNHPNFAPPGNLTLGVAGFGQITSLQGAEGAGPRSMQLSARITF